jgi:tetratricopeptide (TPR) repeat protein
MKGYKEKSSASDCLRNQKGSSAFTFVGVLIVVVVIIGGFMIFSKDSAPKADSNYIAGLDALKNKNYNDAIGYFDKVIKANPNDALAYAGKSKADLGLGALEAALADANTSLQKRPTAQGYGQRGLILKIQRKNDDALKDFTEAINFDGGYAWAYAQRADLYSREKDQEKALKDVNQAVRINDKDVSALRLRVWILNRLGKCKDAAKDIEKIGKLSENDAWTLQDKAWFLLTCQDEKQQDPAKALELAKEALEKSGGKEGVIMETIAEAYFRNGEPLKAVDYQKQAIDEAAKSERCPDGSCLKEMQQRLQKYELAARTETRTNYEVLPGDGGL